MSLKSQDDVALGHDAKHFVGIQDDKRAAFEKTYTEVFEPALKKQQGFQNVKLLRFYAPAQAAEIEASPTEINYQINFVFDSEATMSVPSAAGTA